ncbi:hypothetical protein CWATWH0003_2782 [Crocosphaera watsonii WH 0003]|uniref:Uncharacterized protein n=2 Tax=Crocosphaera watsonii TaxID=263511 RepID=G5J5M7_CROWT|nr:hypothetical protein CWATWH0003_2782 [Crocosphaera watsonii WH 0003]CCQ54609.1 hypothetical protein CWATWH0005_3659 [Crocosphaera watsonii WH 0005]
MSREAPPIICDLGGEDVTIKVLSLVSGFVLVKSFGDRFP